MRDKISISNVCLFLFGFLFLSACNQTFDPIKKSDNSVFSMFGYLDATADTQWIRITPLRRTSLTPEIVPDMTVILEHVETGNSVMMKDSLFKLAGDYNVVNVYSSELDVKPGQTYRIKAERPDGASSRVTVEMPPDYPTPVLFGEGFHEETGILYMKGLENISDVMAIWQIEGEVHYVPYRFNVQPYNESKFNTEFEQAVRLGNRDAMQYIFGKTAPPPYATCLIGKGYVDKRQVFIASGGPYWIDGLADLEDQVYALPQAFSNVENGEGYVIGIVSKTIPFKTCYDEYGEVIACPLEKPVRISTGITSEEAASCTDLQV